MRAYYLLNSGFSFGLCCDLNSEATCSYQRSNDIPRNIRHYISYNGTLHNLRSYKDVNSVPGLLQHVSVGDASR
jgi:hypothetical protein